MFDRQYAWHNVWRQRYLLVLFIMIWVWGCAALETKSVRRESNCNRAADAAVDRQDWGQALVRHQALLKKDPANCLAIYHLGYIQGKQGDRIAETAQYERAVKCGLNKDELLFFNLGMAYGELNFMEKALASFEQAVALNPQNAENYFGLGMTAQAAGFIPRAKSALLKAVEVNPRHWEARMLLARLYLDQGELDAACDHLIFLRKGLPKNEEVAALWRTYEDRRISTFDQPAE